MMQPPAVSVSSILGRIKGGLNRLGTIRIEGEIHSIKPYPSGHVYLDLKDNQADAVLHCVIWRRCAAQLARLPDQGEAVVLSGMLDVFEGRGQLQFIVTGVEAAGEGALFAKFEALKKKLLAEGLFEAALKRSLPRYPRRVGVVTSLQTAALQDVMKTRAGLAPWVPFVVYHSAVQGEASEGEILAALREAALKNEVDVLLLVRGGGALSELWSFNSEAIAREIRRMPMPVVTGIGHETDFTIADMAADVRAPTPTGACALVLREWGAAPQKINEFQKRLGMLVHSAIRLERVRLSQAQRLSSAMRAAIARLQSRVPQPGDMKIRFERYLDNLTERLDRAAMSLDGRRRSLTQEAATRLARQQTRLALQRPQFARQKSALAQSAHLLEKCFALQQHERRARLERLQTSLNALDVSKTLARGFALAVDSSGGVVREASALQCGEELQLHFARGSARTCVVEINVQK